LGSEGGGSTDPLIHLDIESSRRRFYNSHQRQAREAVLAEAYEHLAGMHNDLGITIPLPEKVSNFHDRPFKVIHGDLFAKAILQQIQDPEVLTISQRNLIGGIDQISDSTKLRSDITRRAILRQLYT